MGYCDLQLSDTIKTGMKHTQKNGPGNIPVAGPFLCPTLSADIGIPGSALLQQRVSVCCRTCCDQTKLPSLRVQARFASQC